MLIVLGLYDNNVRVPTIRRILQREGSAEFEFLEGDSVKYKSNGLIVLHIGDLETGETRMIDIDKFSYMFYSYHFVDETESYDFKVTPVYSPFYLLLYKHSDVSRGTCNDMFWYYYHLQDICNDLMNVEVKIGRKWLHLKLDNRRYVKIPFTGNKDEFNVGLMKCKLLMGV